MKIALYLQDITIEGKEAEKLFWSDMEIVAQSKAELLVFPENCFIPSENGIDYLLIDNLDQDGLGKLKNELRERTKKVAEHAGCPVIICHQFDVENSQTINNEGMLSFYFNPNPKGNDTKEKIYLKHVATNESAFDMKPDYETNINNLFQPIVLNEFNIGHLICYDSSFPLFSRAYGTKGVDLIINSTGQHTDYQKWSYYQKVRAIENNCFTLCTMAHAIDEKRNKSFVIGFDLNGKKLENSIALKKQLGKENIFLYEIRKNHKVDFNEGDIDEFFSQNETTSQDADLFITKDRIDHLINKCSENGSSYQDGNICYVMIRNDDIMKPEMVIDKMFAAVDIYDAKTLKFVIINFWDKPLEAKKYGNVLSNVLKVRCVENFCGVIFKGIDSIACYQPTNYKKVQNVEYSSSGFGLSMKRIGGIHSIWKDGSLMQKRWLVRYFQLWNYLTGSKSEKYLYEGERTKATAISKNSTFEIEILDAWMDKIKGVTYLRANICVEGLTTTGDFYYASNYVSLNDNNILNDYFDRNRNKWKLFIGLLYKKTKAFITEHGNGKKENFAIVIKKLQALEKEEEKKVSKPKLSEKSSPPKKEKEVTQNKTSDIDIEVLDAWMDKIKGVTYLKANVTIERKIVKGTFYYSNKYTSLNGNKELNAYFDEYPRKWKSFDGLILKRAKAYIALHGNGERDNFITAIKKHVKEEW